MGDGSISLADGLGLKALDSNELRRRQQVLDPSKSPHFHPPMKEGIQQTGNSGDSSSRINLGNTVHASYSDGSRVCSPKTSKHSSPSRKLQQVFEEALVREAGERASELLVGNTKNGSISDHTISQDLRVETEVVAKGSIPSSSSGGSGALSPKPQINPSPIDTQKFRQQQVTHLHGNTYQFQRTPAEVQEKQGMRSESEDRMLEFVSRLQDELNLSEDPFVLDVVTAKLQSIQQSWRNAELQEQVIGQGGYSFMLLLDLNEINMLQQEAPSRRLDPHSKGAVARNEAAGAMLNGLYMSQQSID